MSVFESKADKYTAVHPLSNSLPARKMALRITAMTTRGLPSVAITMTNMIAHKATKTASLSGLVMGRKSVNTCSREASDRTGRPTLAQNLACPLLAQSRHELVHCKYLLSGVKRTSTKAHSKTVRSPLSGGCFPNIMRPSHP